MTNPQTLDQVIAPVAELLARPAYSEDEARAVIDAAHEALGVKATTANAVGTSAASAPPQPQSAGERR